MAIVGVVLVGYRPPVEASAVSQVNSSVLEQGTATVDQVAAANVASSVAKTLDLAVDNNVQSLATSLNVKTELAQTDTSFITKPQIVQQGGGTGITSYQSKDGDTVQGVAAAFGVSEDTIRWANSLTSDNIGGGKDLKIPGTTGVVYTVKDGDNLDKLADKYKADKDRIVTFNNLELSGLQSGAQIVLPGGILPENERPGYRAPSTGSSSYSVSSYRTGSFSGNGYAYGYCTYYAYNRRAELGRPIGGNWGNATSWAYFASADGYAVDRNPRPGDVFQYGGGLGHVGVVEQVNSDGSLVVSEMNYAGWNIISSRTVSAGQAAGWNYIH